MKHFGDITKLSGYELPVVDVITGGSPCQDLSVAGKRAGLDGERSGLFMEQIRIVKEMRERDRKNGRSGYLIRPRFMVWENVPGAFSSNRGEDFQAVLTEIVRIVEPKSPNVSLPDKGKWGKSGGVYGVGADGCPFSICWRVHDAQFWGVPQRRKRIALVADFGGMSAPEICFERKGMRWYPDESQKEREEAPGRTGESPDKTGKLNAISFQERAGKPGGGKGILIQKEHVGALSTLTNQRVLATTIDEKMGNTYIHEELGNTLSARDYKQPQAVYEEKVLGFNRERCGAVCMEDMQPTIQAAAGESGNNQPNVCVTKVAYGICSYDSNAMKSPNPLSGIYKADTSRTLDLNGGSPACNQGGIAIVETSESRVYDGSRRHGYEPFDDVCETVQAQYGTGGNNTPIVVEPTMIEMTSTKNTIVEDGISPTLTARMGTGGNQVNALCMDVGFFQTNEEKSGALLARQYKDPPITYQEQTGALMASGYNKLGTQEAANDMYITGSVVRRLTPLECERLQGFPDGWTDIGEWVDSKGKKHKDADSPRYKALGNSIAIPFWFYLLRRIAAQYERPATLGSLFDGIGGFPLCWERCNGQGTAIWASEIEEFPIAVTKMRFGQ